MAQGRSNAFFVALLLATVSLKCAANSPSFRTDEKCLNGNNHKERPSPEGPDYAACHQYKTKSCCTAEFTQKLAKATVTNIDNFYWNRCGRLSERCEDYMIAVECFYRCSPNVLHWEGPYQSSLNRVPACHQFCDDWFEACKTASTCAENWLEDFNSTDGTNQCRTDSVCWTFQQRYGTAEGLCNKMWGATFNYTTDLDKCLLINGTDLVRKNELAARRILIPGSSYSPNPDYRPSASDSPSYSPSYSSSPNYSKASNVKTSFWHLLLLLGATVFSKFL